MIQYFYFYLTDEKTEDQDDTADKQNGHDMKYIRPMPKSLPLFYCTVLPLLEK